MSGNPQFVSRQNKQEEIYQTLLAEIHAGKLLVGNLLPSTRALAKHFGSSLTPVNLALKRLAEEGYVEPIHGSGVVIRAASSLESHIRTRPVVEVITTLGNTFTNASPSDFAPQHSIAAVQEWLLWSLHEIADLRVRTCVITQTVHDAQIEKIFEEAIVFKPSVIALPFTEQMEPGLHDLVRRLKNNGTHVVVRASFADMREFDRIYSDFQGGQRDLSRYLIERGHREFLRIAAPLELLYEERKQRGFEDALETIGVSPAQAAEWTKVVTESDLPAHGPARVDHWVDYFERLLRERPQLTAVMAKTDYDTVPIQLALKSLGRDGIEVTGYDNEWSERQSDRREGYGHPNLTAPATVDTRLAEVGKTMAGLVAARAFGHLRDDEIQVRMVPQSLVIPAAA